MIKKKVSMPLVLSVAKFFKQITNTECDNLMYFTVTHWNVTTTQEEWLIQSLQHMEMRAEPHLLPWQASLLNIHKLILKR